MKRNPFYQITFETLAMQPHIISQTEKFSISRESFLFKEFSFDFKKPMISDANLFVLCVSGNATIVVNFVEYEVRPNLIVVILPHYIFQVVRQSDDFKIDFLAVGYDFITTISYKQVLAEIVSLVQKQSYFDLGEDGYLEFRNISQLIVSQYKLPQRYRDSIVKSLFDVLVYKMSGWFLENTNQSLDNFQTRQEEVFRNFTSLLFFNFKEHRTVKFYADQLFITPKYLSKVILAFTGKTSMDWINDITVAAAKALIKTSEMTIKEIADELNFPNSSFFGTYFKSKTGMSPLQYRSI